MTIAFCCRPGKIPDNQICSLTTEPENISTSPNCNNEGVETTKNKSGIAIFLLLVPRVLRAALRGPQCSRHVLLRPPPFHKPKSQNKFWGRVMIATSSLLSMLFPTKHHPRTPSFKTCTLKKKRQNFKHKLETLP